MTVTEPEIREALRRAVDQADLVLEPLAEPSEGRPLPPAPRWPRALAVAAVLLVVIALVAVARSASHDVGTDRGSRTTAPVTASSTTPSPPPPTAPDPSEVTVLVLNGTGTPFHAGTLTEQLGDVGYQTVTANNGELAEDTVVYFAPGEELAAQDLVGRLTRPGSPTAVQPRPDRPLAAGSDQADLVVLLGRSWQPGPLATG